METTIPPPDTPAPSPPGDAAPDASLIQRLLETALAAVAQAPRPRATYRLQFNREFTFRQATEIASYLHALGVSDVYASPYFKTTAGSTHGYDIVDHSSLNPDLGGPDDYESWTAALAAQGMGHVVDFVPNHMGVGTDQNAWWQDVLENGPGSRYAAHFDIDWSPLKTDLECKVLLPVLGDQFGRVLESGELRLVFSEGAFFLEYYARRFPIAPKSFADILGHRLPELADKLPADDPHLHEYQSILTALGHLPPRTETDPARLEERNREKEVIKRRLARLCEESPPIAAWIDENVALFNGKAGEPASFDLLDRLLERQAYRLSFWRVAADEINYRRFFDVNELAAVCMERPAVFDSAHALLFRLMDEERLTGVRIDHADGLYDPTAYLWRLQEGRFLQLARRAWQVEPRDETEWLAVETALREGFAALRQREPQLAGLRPLYLVAEKILERHEELPENWPVHGSTGYEFLAEVNGLFVAAENAKLMDATYARFIGRKESFAEIMATTKRLILRSAMSSELHVLGHALDRISERNRWTRDFTLHGQIQAIREMIVSFPVYRTYTVGETVLERDRRYIEQAAARAKQRNPEMSGEVIDFVRDVLLLAGGESLSPEERAQRQAFVGRFQQFTGPVMAKAVEDTAYYRFNRLTSLNEVGGDPEQFGNSPAAFHEHNRTRQAHRPFGLLATSTHDTKRSEDVRARINVLSELPEEWKRRVAQWSRWNKRKKTKVQGDLAPDRNDEYLLYQTLVGSWPFDPPRGADLARYIERIQQYMTKAVREAKLFSSWIAPNEGYEEALRSFIAAILADEPLSAFRTDFEPCAAQIARSGMWNSLAQTLLKLTAPGVPDLYQGSELWDFSLVDPDNRRPVDFAHRRRLLEEMLPRLASDASGRAAYAAEVLAAAPDGRIKMLVHHQALELRRRSPALFTTGEYLPLETIGLGAAHVIAFLRRAGSEAAITVVPRLTASLTEPLGEPPLGEGVWAGTELVLPEPAGPWRNVFTGETLPPGQRIAIGTVLRTFPVALLAAM